MQNSELINHINPALVDKIKDDVGFWEGYFNYVSNFVPVKAFFAVAGLLFPKVYEVDDYIFFREYCSISKENLKLMELKQDKETVEKRNNLFCCSDIRFGSELNLIPDNYFNINESANALSYWKDGSILVDGIAHGNEYEFALMLEHAWSAHLSKLYPNKEFVFTISKDGMYGEDGVCITFCQKR